MSVFHKIASQMAPARRKLHDLNFKLYGTRTQILRIDRELNDFTNKDFDVFGEKGPSLDNSSVINDVIIQYPFSEVELFANREGSEVNTVSIDLMEVLPTEMLIPFEGDFIDDPIEIQKDDLIVDCLFDHKNNKLPMIFRVKRLRGAFEEKQLIGRLYEIVLHRGELHDNVKTIIDAYINSL